MFSCDDKTDQRCTASRDIQHRLKGKWKTLQKSALRICWDAFVQHQTPSKLAPRFTTRTKRKRPCTQPRARAGGWRVWRQWSFRQYVPLCHATTALLQRDWLQHASTICVSPRSFASLKALACVLCVSLLRHFLVGHTACKTKGRNISDSLAFIVVVWQWTCLRLRSWTPFFRIVEARRAHNPSRLSTNTKSDGPLRHSTEKVWGVELGFPHVHQLDQVVARTSWWPGCVGHSGRKSWFGIDPSSGRARLVDSATHQEIQCTNWQNVTPIEQLGTSVLGKFCGDTLLHADHVTSSLSHTCVSMSFEKSWRICGLLKRAPFRQASTSGAFQKHGVTGFHPAFRTEQIVAEIGPVALFQRRGSRTQTGITFIHTVRKHRKPWKYVSVAVPCCCDAGNQSKPFFFFEEMPKIEWKMFLKMKNMMSHIGEKTDGIPCTTVEDKVCFFGGSDRECFTRGGLLFQRERGGRGIAVSDARTAEKPDTVALRYASVKRFDWKT